MGDPFSVGGGPSSPPLMRTEQEPCFATAGLGRRRPEPEQAFCRGFASIRRSIRARRRSPAHPTFVSVSSSLTDNDVTCLADRAISVNLSARFGPFGPPSNRVPRLHRWHPC